MQTLMPFNSQQQPTFLHKLIANPNVKSAIVNYVFAKVFSCLSMLSIEAAFLPCANGENLYTLLEQKTSDFAPASESLMQFLIKLAKHNPSYFEAYYLAFFSTLRLFNNNNAFSTLQLKQNLQRRLILRQAIATVQPQYSGMANHFDLDQVVIKIISNNTNGQNSTALIELCLQCCSLEHLLANILATVNGLETQVDSRFVLQLLLQIQQNLTAEQQKCFFNGKDFYGNSGLHQAIELCAAHDTAATQAILSHLLDRTAYFTTQDFAGHNFLHLAIKYYAEGSLSNKAIDLIISKLEPEALDELLAQRNFLNESPTANLPLCNSLIFRCKRSNRKLKHTINPSNRCTIC